MRILYKLLLEGDQRFFLAIKQVTFKGGSSQLLLGYEKGAGGGGYSTSFLYI